MKINLVCSILLLFNIAFGQVSNDDIENRIELEMNKPVLSSTDDCTLEMKCINKEILGKCITFHNDQWFEFTPLETKTYYINLSNQKCRDILGVQVVVIDGEACKPAMHKLITCVSLANQNDIFITLDSLTKNKNYLIILDGYLHDYCAFSIEFSDKPKGFPINTLSSNTNFHVDQSKRFISFNWTVDNPKCNDYEKYLIYKRHSSEKKSFLINEIEHQKTSLGTNILNYNINDTLEKRGKYEYLIIAQKCDSTFVIIEEFSRVLDVEIKIKDENQFITIHKTFKRKTPIIVMVEDVFNNRIIYHKELAPSQEHYSRLFIGEHLEKGITHYKVTIQNGKTGKKETQLYAF